MHVCWQTFIDSSWLKGHIYFGSSKLLEIEKRLGIVSVKDIYIKKKRLPSLAQSETVKSLIQGLYSSFFLSPYHKEIWTCNQKALRLNNEHAVSHYTLRDASCITRVVSCRVSILLRLATIRQQKINLTVESLHSLSLKEVYLGYI